ncbi:MAG: glycosyltransferase [Candidatus Saccharibacteria bacterium]
MEPLNYPNDKRSDQPQDTIAIFIPDLMCGGAERVMIDLAGGITECDCEVDLVLSSAEGPFLNQVPVGINVVDLKCKRVLFSLPKLIKYLRSRKPSIILTAKDHVNVLAIISAMFSQRSRSIITIHDMTDSMYNLFNSATSFKSRMKEKVIQSLAKILYPKTAAIIAVSQAAAEEFSSFYNIDPRRINVIYNPLDFERISFLSKQDVDHPWFGEGQAAVILGIGRLEQEKDFATLIRAFATVREHIQARLIIMGLGSQQAELQNLIDTLNLQNEALLWGYEENPYKYIKAAGVVALSSKYETLPTVLIETLYLQKGFVGTNCCGGIHEIIGDTDYPYLVPTGDHKQLAQALIDYLNKKPKPHQIDFEKFGKKYAVAKYLAVFKNAISEGEIPVCE